MLPTTHLQQSLDNKRNWLLFFALAVVYVLAMFCAKILLTNDELYLASLAGQMTEEQARTAIELNKEWNWAGYFLFPLLLLTKFAIIAGILSTGYYISANRWVFAPFFRAAIIAEFVMILPVVIRIFWFGSVHPNYNLSDLQNFYPLSISSLFSSSQVEAWLRYPLQVASLFEVAYWLLIIKGVHQLLDLSWSRATRLVGLSYGPALLIWMLLVMFTIVSTS